jgi:hypothetical protein
MGVFDSIIFAIIITTLLIGWAWCAAYVIRECYKNRK